MLEDGFDDVGREIPDKRQIVHGRVVKETLNLTAVEIESQDTIHTGIFEEHRNV